MSESISGIKTIVRYVSSLTRCDLSQTPLCGPLSGLFWIHWLVFWQVNLWEKWSSCLRGYSFQLGVQHPFLIGLVLAMYFWHSLGSPSTDFWSYLFLDLWGKELFPGVSMSALCRLNVCSGGTLFWWKTSAWGVSDCSPAHSLAVNFTQGSCRWLGASSPSPPLSSELFLSFYHMRGSSVWFFFLCFSLGQSVSRVIPPHNSTLYLPQ